MATPKQIAALKKARAAKKRKAKVGSKKTRKPKKTLSKKRVYSSNPKRKNTYIVKIVIGSKAVYYVRPGVFETSQNKATRLSESGSAKVARSVFDKYKGNSALKSVSTVKKT